MKNYIAFIILALSFSGLNYAQYGSSGGVDARSMGFAKTYNSTTKGVYSIGINPANLVYSQNHSIEISSVLPLPFISLRTGTNFASINDINYFFGKVNGQSRYLNNADKQRFNDLFNNGGLILANIGMSLLSFSYKAGPDIGAFAFSINDAVAGRVNIPKALIEIGLNGNPVGKEYDLSDGQAKAWWIRDYSLSYAKNLKNVFSNIFNKFSAGVTFKYVNGFAYVSTDPISTTLTTEANGTISGTAGYRAITSFSDNFGVKYDFDKNTSNSSSNFSLFPTPSGSGYGLDIGFAGSIDHTWRFGFAVTDIGNIKWTKNDAQFTAEGKITFTDITDKTQTNNFNDKITGVSSRLAEFTTDLPTALRMGASYYLDKEHSPISGTLLLAIDYNQGLNDLPGNSKSPRFSLGAEWKPGDWIPYLRTGLSFGGRFGFHWAAGIGIDAGIVEFNLSTSSFQAVVAPNSSRYISIAFGSLWKF